MKKNLLLLTALFISFSFSSFAQRFLSETFTSVNVTTNIVYGNNFSVLTGVPTATDLKMDIYEPAGDVAPVRPLIIYLHTGSFIPAVANQNPTGGKTDSTVVEMCTQFAKRGYVVASATYRQGWVPTSPDQDVRTGTLLQAVYRAIQDAKACVRYFYANASASNTYKVDTNNIILGGQGTGGYVALAYATLDDVAEIQISKFLSNSTNATYGFQLGQPYVNTAVLGDFDGYGGNAMLNNPNNSVGFSNKISFVFNMGGAMGDSSWLESGDVPMVAFHVTNDPFAPYGNGPVYVPTVPPQFVVQVSGSQTVITKANALGNNNCFAFAGFNDPYTTAANANNGGQDGLFPFLRPTSSSGIGEAGPWEWYDSTALTVYAQALGLSASAGTAAYVNGLQTNPDMSKAKALAYIDTIQNYLNPRMVFCLQLPTGIFSIDDVKQFSIYPNPANNNITVEMKSGEQISSVIISDVSGKIIQRTNSLNNTKAVIPVRELPPGIYSVRVMTDKLSFVKKLIVE